MLLSMLNRPLVNFGLVQSGAIVAKLTGLTMGNSH